MRDIVLHPAASWIYGATAHHVDGIRRHLRGNAQLWL
jgi:hypothetical protein